MDAFAVSICKGMATQHVSAKHMCIAGLWFGGFQMLMPLAGYFLGSTFARYIQKYDHWIAFCLLSAIGAQAKQTRKIANVYIRLANKEKYKVFQNESYGFLSGLNLI